MNHQPESRPSPAVRALLGAGVAGLLCPMAAQAHGEQILAFPLSGVIAFGALVFILLRARARVVVKWLTLLLGLPVALGMTWFVVFLLDPSAGILVEGFWLFTVLMAVPPVLACTAVLRHFRRPD